MKPLSTQPVEDVGYSSMMPPASTTDEISEQIKPIYRKHRVLRSQATNNFDLANQGKQNLGPYADIPTTSKIVNKTTASHTILSNSVSIGEAMSSGNQSASTYLLKGKVNIKKDRSSAIMASSSDIAYHPQRQSYEVKMKPTLQKRTEISTLEYNQSNMQESDRHNQQVAPRMN